MADIKISELTAVSSLNNGDLVEVSQVNELAPSGYTSLKASMADLGKKVNTDIEYTTDLADFADKTTLGAIKETAKGKNVADEYDDTQTYNKGDVVIYKNTLYICTTNNTTGAWDATKWTATTVQSLIGDLSDLTTTNQDSLVDAVNEVVSDLGNKADKTDIAVTNSTLSVKTGVSITLARSQVWKCNGLAFVTCAFTATANISLSTEILTTPSGYNALSLTDLVGTDNANNGKPFYISGNTITANGALISGTSYFINGVFRTTA